MRQVNKRKVNNRKLKSRKYSKFYRNYKKILSIRENEIVHSLQNVQLDKRNESDGDNSQIERTKDFKLNDELKTWAIGHQVTMRSLNSLLKLLRSNGHIDLPRNYRTLLKTPRKINLSVFGDSKYWYHGIEPCLRFVFCKLDRHLKIGLIINIDGLPIFNSSQFQFWPILATINGEQCSFDLLDVTFNNIAYIFY